MSEEVSGRCLTNSARRWRLIHSARPKAGARARAGLVQAFVRLEGCIQVLFQVHIEGRLQGRRCCRKKSSMAAEASGPWGSVKEPACWPPDQACGPSSTDQYSK